ncbi:MAG TPA: alcohol dehydrogenase catalytic domain-containing protein [Anaerolineae bacterium]|nr:alcohol dehydrogenase catalytic domain-containing protein [Anaerolineae bacterium]
MRALYINHGLYFEKDYAKPMPPAGEALIRVLQAGVCNTDLELVKGYLNFKGVPGHEFVGVVEQAAGRSDLIGKRVVGEINAACGVCETCRAGRPTHCPNRTTLGIDRRDGAFAEYLSLPFENLHPLPDSVSTDQAVFVEPLAAACEILEQIQIHPTDRVVVIGDGKLGLLCTQVIALTGCQLTLLGRHPDKLLILKEKHIRTTTQLDEFAPASIDIVIEATGTPSGFETARKIVRPRGTIVLKSTYNSDLNVNLTMVVVDEVSLIGSRCGPFEPAIRLLANRQVEVDQLIQARYSIQEGLKAFEHAATKGTLKVIVSMTNE